MAKTTLKEVIISFLQGKKDGVATLKQIYEGVDESGYETSSETVHNSARRTIYTNTDTFKRVCKGVYMLKGAKTTSLIIEGDGRKMEEIDDNSISCIITVIPGMIRQIRAATDISLIMKPSDTLRKIFTKKQES